AECEWSAVEEPTQGVRFAVRQDGALSAGDFSGVCRVVSTDGQEAISCASPAIGSDGREVRAYCAGAGYQSGDAGNADELLFWRGDPVQRGEDQIRSGAGTDHRSHCA